MAEMFLRKPFLMGTDWKNQLFLILDLLGSPSEADTEFIENENAKKFLGNFPSDQKDKLKDFFKDSAMSAEGFDLLKRLLVFNPNK